MRDPGFLKKNCLFPVLIPVLGFLFVLVGLTGMVSCSEAGFLGVEDGQAVRISTLPAGSYITPEEEISVSLASRDPAAEMDSLHAELLDAKGAAVQEWSYGSVDPAGARGEPFLLKLKGDLGDGVYRLKIRVEGVSGKILASREVPLFCTAFSRRIRSIGSYPSELHPGAVVLLEPDLLWEGDRPPYLRWRVDGRIIREGVPVAENSPLRWKVPDQEGVYPISLEVFPGAYAEAGTAGGADGADGGTLISSLKAETAVYVSESITAEPGELGPEGRYGGLYHFRGDVRSEGADMGLRGADPFRFERAGGVYGYRTAPGESLRSPHPLLPLQGGALQPFTVSLRAGDAEELPRGIFFAASQGRDFSLSLERRGEGFFLSGRLRGRSYSLALGRAVPPAGGKVLEFHLTGIPRPQGWRFLLFQGGRLLGAGDLSGEFEGFSGQGTFRLADFDRGSFLLDEFGVYRRDEHGRPASDRRIFRRSLKTPDFDAGSGAGAGSFLAAEGFEGAVFPEEMESFQLEGAADEEGPVMTGASLVLPRGHGVRFPPLALSREGRYLLAGRFRAGVISLAWEGKDEPFLLLDEEGQIVLPGDADWKRLKGSAERAGTRGSGEAAPGCRGPLPREGEARQWQLILEEDRMMVQGDTDAWVNLPAPDGGRNGNGSVRLLLGAAARTGKPMEVSSFLAAPLKRIPEYQEGWFGREEGGEHPSAQGF